MPNQSFRTIAGALMLVCLIIAFNCLSNAASIATFDLELATEKISAAPFGSVIGGGDVSDGIGPTDDGYRPSRGSVKPSRRQAENGDLDSGSPVRANVGTEVSNDNEYSIAVNIENYKSQICTPDLFLPNLVWSDVFKWKKEHKEDLVWMPSKEAEQLEQRERMRAADKYLPKFFSALEVLSTRQKTIALIYGESNRHLDDGSTEEFTCVWLASSSGLIAYASVPASNPSSGDPVTDDDFLQVVWTGLRVNVRSAVRSPTSRDAGKGCEEDQTISDAPLSKEQLDQEKTALQKAKKHLIPDEIASMLQKEATKNARLLIIPARAAQKVPFAALPLGSGYLVDLYAPMIVPSAEDIILGAHSGDLLSKEMKKSTDTGKVVGSVLSSLVVGDPDLSYDKSICWPPLPHALEEVEFVATTLGDANPLTGIEAAFDKVKSKLKSGQKSLRVIYFATHGMTDPNNPADGSFLALNKRHLSGSELRKLDLKFERSPIVVMSACFSGLGKVFPGGLFGLTDFWLRAGASDVVVSLWAVSDEGTSKLMKLFATELASMMPTQSKKYGGGAENALAVAMRKLKEVEPDPAIWSAFIVSGNPSP